MLDFRVFIQKLLNTRFFNFALVFSIDFVADQDERELLRLFGSPLIEKLSDPGLNVIEGLSERVGTRLLVMSYTSTQQSAPR